MSTVAKLRLAFELYAAGEEMMRQSLRRRFPHDSDAAIEGRLNAWLSERPGAEDGDTAGRRAPWPRSPP